MHDVHTTTAIDFSAPPVAGRIERRAFIIGGFAAIVSLVAALLDFHYFLRPYLVAYMFVLGVTLGCLSLLLLEKMTGGQWGVMSRRILEAATAQLPMMAILFLPIAFGLHSLYHWSHAEAVAHDPVLQAKAGYLNAGFWYLRAVIYFAIWLFLGFSLIRWSRRQDTQGYNRGKIGTVAGPGIVLYVLTITFSSVDWVMSLNPHWFSTMFGLLFVAGNVLMAMSFVAMITATFMKYEPFSLTVRLRHLHDYGKLMLAFTMLWAYLNFSQWLIVWSGNLPEETPWYIARLQHGWQYVSLALVVFHFILPFLLLLSRDLKKNTKTLMAIAIWLMGMRYLDILWNVVPNFHNEPGAPAPHIAMYVAYVAAPLAIGGLWLGFFSRELRKHAILPFNDPHLAHAIEPEHQGH